MSYDPLATPCGLYCGFCRFYMKKECGGCGSSDRLDCGIFKCSNEDKNLRFCTECKGLPCKELEKSVGLDPRWLEELTELPLKRKEQ